MKKNNKDSIKLAVYSGLLIGIGFILNFIQIPYIVGWLKLDISEVVTLIATSISLPIGLIVGIGKGILMMITGTSSGFIGELTLILGSIIIACTYYFSKKYFGIKTSLFIMILVFSSIMTILNYFIITPIYMDSAWQILAQNSYEINESTINYATYIIALYLPFNLIKSTLVSVIFYFINIKLKDII